MEIGFGDYMHPLFEDITKAYRRYMDEGQKEAEKEFAQWQRTFLKEVFQDAITDFYSAHTPTKYSRRGDMGSRTGGLYDLYALSDSNSETPLLDFDSSSLYNKANMHQGRKGYNGLFELVFVEGYHGGARTISPGKAKIWGKHPDGSTPYWRRRGFVRVLGRMHDYGKWGRAAKKTTPPKDLVETHLESKWPEMQDKYDELVKKYKDDKFEDFKTVEAQKIVNDYLMRALERIRGAVR